jgi:hypothetical protein
MPDHILELWMEPWVPAMIVEEGDPARDLADGVRQFQDRVRRSWGGHAQLKARPVEPLEGKMRGSLVTFDAQTGDGGGVETIQAAVFIVSGKVVQALIQDPAQRSGKTLKQVLASLECR